jgi:zinc protease
VRATWAQDVLRFVRDQAVHAQRDPHQRFAHRVDALMTQDHPYYRPDRPADVDTLPVAAACAFFRRCFANAAEYTFVLAGRIDPVALRPTLASALGALPTANVDGLLPVTVRTLPFFRWGTAQRGS